MSQRMTEIQDHSFSRIKFVVFNYVTFDRYTCVNHVVYNFRNVFILCEAISSKSLLSRIIPYLMASAIPSESMVSESVDKTSGSQITQAGCLKAPTRFFPHGRSIAVFPPTEESTWAKSVVGICIYSSPLKNVAAAKPVISPTTPPPRAITQSVRVMLFSQKKL